MQSPEIDVHSLRVEVLGLIQQFGPPRCELLLVDSVELWAQSLGLEEQDPFRAAMATTRRQDGVPFIVVLKRITEDIQGSVIGALLFRGFGSEADRLRDPALFLEHLVLHEIAHLVLENPSESDCDRWAFDRLGGKLSVSFGGAA